MNTPEILRTDKLKLSIETEKLIECNQSPFAIYLRDRYLQKALMILLDTGEIEYDAVSIMEMVVLPEDMDEISKHLIAARSLENSGQFHGELRQAIIQRVNSLLVDISNRGVEEKMVA